MGQFLEQVGQLARERDKPLLADRLTEEIGQLHRLDTTLVIAGESNTGKSSLINALLGRPGLLPVGPDVTTNARIVVRYAAQESVRVHREDAGAPSEVEAQSVDRWASVAGNPNNEKGVRLVEIGLDLPLLAAGLVIVDTPGVGGLSAAHAAVTLVELETADALLFVTDASGPLTEPELSFLRRGADRIATVMFALTKRDLYPGWQATLDENKNLLAAHVQQFSTAPFVALSSRARLRAQSATDPELAERMRTQSGFAELERALSTRVMGGAQVLRLRNCLQLARTAIRVLAAAEQFVLMAATDGGELKAALMDASADKSEFARSRRYGTVRSMDDFVVLEKHLLRDLNRAVNALKRTYEQDIRANKLKPEAVAESLDADLRAMLGELDVTLRAGVRDIASQFAQEIDVALSVDGTRLEMPPEFSEPLEADPSDLDGVAKFQSFMPSLFGVALLPNLVRVLGPLLPVGAIAVAPIAGIAGLALIPLNLVHRKRVRDQQEARQLVGLAVERARTEIPPLISEVTVRLRRAFEQALQAGMDQRESELSKAVERQQQLMDEGQNARDRAQEEAQRRLDELLGLGKCANELDRLLRMRGAGASLRPPAGSAARTW